MGFVVTGAAGFIGFHVARRLLAHGERVIGLDNVNDYYSVKLKRDRLAALVTDKNFIFREVDIADNAALMEAVAGGGFRRIIHLAAQAGVRYGIDNPHVYAQSNLVGHLNMLELARRTDRCEAMIYASSSSVYGGNTKMPFSEEDRVDTPISLYAATKKADEVMSHAYAHLFGTPLIGLRFFTVYGPWGRPDMALWLFTKAILAGEPIKVFNHGRMKRDFTYIDDIVSGITAIALDPTKAAVHGNHRIYNIGHNRPEDLMHMIAVLEEALDKKAEMQMLPLQPGDVPESYADIAAIQRDYGFVPKTPISRGIPAFVDWYKSYHGTP
ncbi:MAG: GDP-mannose 4,6-dehydratase [Alphaproteobacteria bacterium]|nr:GDP-mannose 4,6-dehydratase [Alphaproteobacteria bacterium]MBV9693612.1 GDP-mannose 4,6-dehydratase [Alphaproteobacteria bacterium]